jgi:Fic family protein
LSYVVLTTREREDLAETFFHLMRMGDRNPTAKIEVMTALRCLKAVHSNAIEDKKVDRIFLQVLLHNAGVADKSLISKHYFNAAKELRGHEEMLLGLEEKAVKREEFSISFLLQMHNLIFRDSKPDGSGKFRQDDVRIQGMIHRPPHHSKVSEMLYQQLHGINERLFSIKPTSRSDFFDVLRISAEIHYLIASVHPFEDGNGRIARAAGDYVLLIHGFYYDVVMTDYRDIYLDALEECSSIDVDPLMRFLEYSYLETLKRISGFFQLVEQDIL